MCPSVMACIVYPNDMCTTAPRSAALRKPDLPSRWRRSRPGPAAVMTSSRPFSIFTRCHPLCQHFCIATRQISRIVPTIFLFALQRRICKRRRCPTTTGLDRPMRTIYLGTSIFIDDDLPSPTST